MSNGDGRDPGNPGKGNNGVQTSGNVKGTSGKSGLSSAGGTNPNSGAGWGTTHTPNGDIHNYNPGEFGNGCAHTGAGQTASGRRKASSAGMGCCSSPGGGRA